MKTATSKSMEHIIFNETLMQYFEKQNKVGLAELLMFGDHPDKYFDSEWHKNRVLNNVINVCQDAKKPEPFHVSAKDFAMIISYDDFKARRGISPAMALDLRLYLLHQCGVNWLEPGKLVIGF